MSKKNYYITMINSQISQKNKNDNNNISNNNISNNNISIELNNNNDFFPITIDDINTDIYLKYEYCNDSNEQYVIENNIYNNQEYPFYSLITNSANNDCLINSFLINVSPNFRKLLVKDQYSYSSYFRRSIITKLPLENYYKYNIIELLQSSNFLTDIIIEILAKNYNINIITFEPISNNNIIINESNIKNNKYICIYNPTNTHFSSVCFNQQNSTENKFILSFDEYNIIEKFNISNIK